MAWTSRAAGRYRGPGRYSVSRRRRCSRCRTARPAPRYSSTGWRSTGRRRRTRRCGDPVVRRGASAATPLYAEVPLPRPRVYAKVPLPRPRCTQRCLCRDPAVRKGASAATQLYAKVPLPRPRCTQRCLCLHGILSLDSPATGDRPPWTRGRSRATPAPAETLGHRPSASAAPRLGAAGPALDTAMHGRAGHAGKGRHTRPLPAGGSAPGGRKRPRRAGRDGACPRYRGGTGGRRRTRAGRGRRD